MAELAVTFIGATLPTPLYVIYRREFHFSEIVLTLLYAVYVVGTLTALIFFGRLSDEFGRRRTTLLAFVVGAASSLVFAFGAGVATLFLGRALSGFAVGLAAGSGTAWIAELEPSGNRARATRIAATGNISGLGVGPLVAGLLAEYAPMPTRLPYFVFLAMLIVTAAVVWQISETVENARTRWSELSLKPRVGVPAESRLQFISPAATAAVIFALFGFYTSLIPSLLIHALHVRNHVASGVVVLELASFGVAALFGGWRLTSHVAMLVGAALMLPSLALLVLTQELRSLPFLLAGAATGGVAVALGYRGSLQVVNQIAPGGRRAELISSYLVAAYVGISVPVIGIGVLTEFAGPSVADVTFGAIIAVLSVAAIVAGIRYRPE